MSSNTKYFLFLFSFIFLISCTTQLKRLPRSQRRLQDAERLQKAAKEWLHTPYRLGGIDSRGIDCSALTQAIYLQVYNMKIPRSTHGQRRLGYSVAFSYLQSGDLLFFRMHKSGSLDHVGIYLGQGRFIHASSSRGVVISSLNNSFYRRHFIIARRVRH